MHFDYDFSLIFYLGGCIFFLWMIVSKRKAMTKKRDLVQLKNPISKRYVLVDRTTGSIISHKKSSGPYKGVPIHEKLEEGVKKYLSK